MTSAQWIFWKFYKHFYRKLRATAWYLWLVKYETKNSEVDQNSVPSRRNLGTTFSGGGLVYFPQYQQNFIDLY